MKIGIYKDTLANRRGADFAVLAIADGLRERGHDAVVFEKGDFGKRMAETWDVVISTGTNELCDLYDCFSTRSTRSTRLIPFPIIQQFHTNPKSQFKWKRFVRNWKIRRALRRVSAIQVLSEDFVPQVAKYGVPVSVIGNWSMFSSVVKLPSPTLTSNSTIIYPAAFAKGKNQKLLIKAFALLSSEFPDWKLRLFGRADGPYADECRRLAVKSGVAGRVEFAGFRDGLAAEYGSCAFVAFPSADEGFPLTVADAATFGKPCVTVRDWIGAASADGGVVTRSTVEAYAEGLRRLMGDPGLRGRMGESARKFVLERYSRERILDEWESLVSKVVAVSHV